MAQSASRRFKSLRRSEPLYRKVAALIRARIDTGDLKVGEKLPTESQLSEQFGVSRNVVREAVACLKSDGVIGSQQGLGAFVLPLRERSSLRIDGSALEDAHKLRELFELRHLLEVEAAGLAAQRRSAEDLAAIEAAFHLMRRDSTFSPDAVDADLNFHRQVARATGNEYVLSFLSFISNRMGDTIHAARVQHARKALAQVTLAEHQAILDDIRAGDSAAARNSMARHLRGAASRLRLLGSDDL